MLSFISLAAPHHFCHAKDLVLAPWSWSHEKTTHTGGLFMAPAAGLEPAT